MKLRISLGIFLGLILLIGVIPAYATNPVSDAITTDGDRQVIQVDNLMISVPTSQVPFYHYWLVDDNTTIYRVHFDTMFEIIDVNNNSAYDQYNDPLIPQSVTPLAQMTWSLSEVSTTEGVVSFNLTGVVTGFNPTVDPDLVIQFRNHISTTDGVTELKFDVAIFNYDWKNPDSLLVLGFKLDVADMNYGIGPKAIHTALQTRAEFGAGYMESVDHAYSGENGQYEHQIQSRMTVGNATQFNGDDTNPRLFITYEHFTGDLLHDPTLGIDQSAENTFVADTLTIKVPTSQVPFYFFWQTDHTDTTYRVAFDTIFEIRDSNGNGLFDSTEQLVPNSVFPLALLDWQMSDIVNTTNNGLTTYNFNLTGSAGNNPQVGDVYIAFNNHITVNGNESELKFDIIINNYVWTDSSESTMLVLGFKLTSTDDLYTGTPTRNQTRATFGNAYMETVQTATMNNGTDHQLNVSMSIGDGSRVNSQDSDARIYLAYTHFDGNMTHDPSLGLLSVEDDGSSATTPTGDTTEDTGNTPLSVFTFPVLTALIAIPVIIRLRKSG